MLRLVSDSWIHGIPLPPFLNTRTTSECHDTAGFPRFCLIVGFVVVVLYFVN